MTQFSKTLAFLAIGVASSTVAVGQTSTPIGTDAQMNLNALATSPATSNVRMFDNRYQGVKGSPYFLEAWVPGTVELKTNNTGKSEVFKDLRLKYDVFTNLLFAVLPQTKDTIQFSTAPVLTFSLELPTNPSPLLFTRLKEAKALDPALAESFFAVVLDSEGGKAKLVKRVAKSKIEANFKGAYSSGQAYDELIDETQYYVVANGAMRRVKLNRKSVLEALPDQAEKLKSFISSQKIAMNSETDLIKVVAYSQTL
ncbi:hypothetical protein ACD591_16795 [Rufibacter glacialis]|uniref:Uncharacterized protein n=1 Tax=Rufibacter glacialis TaxID=1259555 RepID=A0A5M8QGZ1_9BACT|nr:hypothetical protein [Rufibacter glacialis]KAA6434244.1 hypothetical protein FOE74_08530 [Rufibacter glacialis]GGK68061.1 hypothetical protein GCM10011405_15030 [Rufibacter glacialis]